MNFELKFAELNALSTVKTGALLILVDPSDPVVQLEIKKAKQAAIKKSQATTLTLSALVAQSLQSSQLQRHPPELPNIGIHG